MNPVISKIGKNEINENMIANVEKCLLQCTTSDNVDGFDAPSVQNCTWNLILISSLQHLQA